MNKKFRLSYYILGAMVLGALFGYAFPSWGVAVKPFGDAFIRLIKMIVIPVIVSTLLVGVAGTSDIKGVGRLGVRTIIWFEFITTLVLFIGLALGNLLKPGAGVVLESLSKADITTMASNTKAVLDTKTLLLNIIPTNVVDVLAKGDLLAVIFFCVMFGMALIKMGNDAKPVVEILDIASKTSFKLVSIVMVVSPIGVFALTASTVGAYGVKVLLPLLKLIGTAYLGVAILIFGLFPLIALFLRVSIKEVYKLIWDLLVIGGCAGTMEPILAELMERLNKWGVPKQITSFVIPLGMPLNSDGLCIYLCIASMFIAQVYGIDLSWQQQLFMLAT